jgi:hypothetical protein
MKRLIVALCLTALPMLPAAAAPACTISPIKGLTDPTGAQVTMTVSTPGRPCGTKLWVQTGVIPFEALRATRQPQHGHLTVSDPTQFSYSPDADYTGSDVFEIIARGNNRGGGQVTGTLHVDVTVTRDR